MKINKRLSVGFLSVLSLFTLAIAPAFAATTTVVYPGDMHGWSFIQEDTAAGFGTMVEGPGTPPLGTGSAQLMVDSTGRENLYTLAYAGTPLSSITNLQYSTYSQTPTTTLAPTLAFDIDYNVNNTPTTTTYQGRLTFEPYMNGTVTSGTWQTWNPLTGVWWASRAPGNTNCGQATPCTWTQILTAFPNARIHTSGALLFRVGQWSSGFIGNVDAFTINTTTYDFESQYVTPTPTPTPSPTPTMTPSPTPTFTPTLTPTATPIPTPSDKSDCMFMGWINYSFKNQGQCISFTNHN